MAARLHPTRMNCPAGDEQLRLSSRAVIDVVRRLPGATLGDLARGVVSPRSFVLSLTGPSCVLCHGHACAQVAPRHCTACYEPSEPIPFIRSILLLSKGSTKVGASIFYGMNWVGSECSATVRTSNAVKGEGKYVLCRSDAVGVDTKAPVLIISII